MNLHVSKRFFIIVSFLFAFFCLEAVGRVYQYREVENISRLFDGAMNDRAFPGGCVAAGSRHHTWVEQCYGYFTYAEKTKDDINDLFDLASLTKVIATTPAIMKLYEQGKIHLDDPVVNYLPEFRGPTSAQTRLKNKITVRDLLTHASGLPPDISVDHLPTLTAKWQAIYQVPLVAYRHQYTIYSDLNFILLGKIVEKVTQMSLDQYVTQTLFKPLGMSHTTFHPKELSLPIVPTEYQHQDDGLLVGEVHDPLARSLGVAGNAGLFSNLHDLNIFAQMWLNQGSYQGVRLFKPSTVNAFAKRALLITGSSRALGWDTVYNPLTELKPSDRSDNEDQWSQYFKPPHQFSAGMYIDPDAIGHTGYTGTSLWISRKNGVYVILLTNRVTPYASPLPKHKYWRQQINSAVWENLGFTEKNLTFEEPKI